ncbi:MAG: Holliday junction resolvase Hjc [Nanoarchaeota archaeon]|nr:Holliday junction resolvase [Nanoarchaeota archaeon]MBU1632161.1 Holliday junction resolvase [Nanoarchaeota archaeon]MBU1876362.1 Holliday junction resolvase [Nanoarchaeota archaeon]
MNRKAKGTNGERELIKFFNESGTWSAIRSAGSGSSRYPSPDVLAANAIRRLAIECKTTKDKKKYFQEDEIEQLQTFSQKFGAESWIGVRFPNQPWYFLMLEDLEKTGKGWAISLELAERKGLLIEELIGTNQL